MTSHDYTVTALYYDGIITWDMDGREYTFDDKDEALFYFEELIKEGRSWDRVIVSLRRGLTWQREYTRGGWLELYSEEACRPQDVIINYEDD